MGMTDPEMSRPQPLPEEFQTSSPLRTTRCCFCFSFRRSSLSSDELNQHHWWDRGIHALKKLREWSELVAGPKWKTFIRRFSRNNNRWGNGRLGRYQYDALSYSLNFDEGQSGDIEDRDDYAPMRNFSSRYASVGVKEAAVS